MAERSHGQIRLGRLFADGRGQVRDLEGQRLAVHEAEPLEDEHPRALGQAQLLRHAPIGPPEAAAEKPGRHVLAHGAEIPRERPELEDVVVDGRGRHEGAEAVAARDQALAREHVEGLAERHERHSEGLGELALIVETLPRRQAARADARAQSLGDLVIARHRPSHLRLRAPGRSSRTLVATQRRRRATERDFRRNDRQLRQPRPL